MVVPSIRPARLSRTKHGWVPSGGGWFVVNTARARWWKNPRFGAVCAFEGKKPFRQLGINLRVIPPGRSNCMYHRESDQEDFLVLSGTCRLLIEEREILLKAWDFVHCPPGTTHVFVGAGRRPCVVLMVGARRPGWRVIYPVSPLARRYDAGVPRETRTPRVAYARFPRWKPGRVRWPIA